MATSFTDRVKQFLGGGQKTLNTIGNSLRSSFNDDEGFIQRGQLTAKPIQSAMQQAPQMARQALNTYNQAYNKVSPFVPFAIQQPKPIAQPVKQIAEGMLNTSGITDFTKVNYNRPIIEGWKPATAGIVKLAGTAATLPYATAKSVLAMGSIGGALNAGVAKLQNQDPKKAFFEGAGSAAAASGAVNATGIVAGKLASPLLKFSENLPSGIKKYLAERAYTIPREIGQGMQLSASQGRGYGPLDLGVDVAQGLVPGKVDVPNFKVKGMRDIGKLYKSDIEEGIKLTEYMRKNPSFVENGKLNMEMFTKAEKYTDSVNKGLGLYKTKDELKEWARMSIPDKLNTIINAYNERVNVYPEQIQMGLVGKNPSQAVQPNGVGINARMKPRGFTTSVKESTNVSGEVKPKVNGVYAQKPNTKLMGEAAALLQDGASLKFESIDDLDKKVAATIQEAINLDKAGNHKAAANLLNNLSEAGTKIGRGTQAFSMIDKMSPQAIALSAAGKIKAYNRTAKAKIPELTGEQTKLISDQVAKIDSLTGRDKNIAINQLQETINNFIPSSIGDKIITLWKAGLLTSLRTHERNLLGNTIMSGFEGAKDVIASPFDQLMALRTGQRSMTLTGRGVGSGLAKGGRAAKDIVMYGFDPEESIASFDVKRTTWGNNPVEQFFKHATNAVFRTLGGEDKPFWNAMYARSLYDQAGAAAINAGKQGDGKFIEKLVKKPTEEMLNTAFKDANYATFHDKNGFSKLATNIKKSMSDNEYKKFAAEFILPFTGVPSSIVTKTLDYSPVGLITGIQKVGKVLAGQVPELQRQAAQEISRGIMGTGLYGLGAYLVAKGLMTGQPKDTDEADLWKAQGKQANSVLIDGQWRSINSIGPQNLAMLAGAKFQEEMQNPEGFDPFKLGANLVKDQLSQTFLAGVQGPLNAINDPKRYAQNYIGNSIGSVVPNIVKDAGKALDPLDRETNTIQDFAQKSIPLLRNKLIAKRDVLGNTIAQEPTGLMAFTDLFNSKTPINNSILSELDELAQSGNDATPSKLGPAQSVLKNKVKLSFEQLDNLEAGVGKIVKPQIEALIASPAYQQLEDEKKKTAIGNIISNARTKYKNMNAGTLLTDATTKAKNTDIKAIQDQIKSGAIDKTVGTKRIIELGGSAGKTVPQAKQTNITGKKYDYVDDEGNYKTVDLTPIKKPELTGNSVLDEKLQSKYNSSLTTQSNGIITLYKQGQLTKKEATDMIAEIETQSIDVSKPIEYPALTGNELLDKKLVSKYKSEITQRGNDVMKLYENGKITKDEAESMLTTLQAQANGTKKAKKGKAITLGKITPRKVSSVKISFGKLPTPNIKRKKLTLSKKKSSMRIKA